MPSNRLIAYTIACVAVAAGVCPPAAFARAEVREEVFRRIDRTITITGAPLLEVRKGDAGLMRIRTHGRPEVRVEASIRVSAESRDVAARFIDTFELNIVEAPARVTIGMRPVKIDRRYPGVSFAIDLDVLVPERARLEARNNFGPLEVTAVNADATFVTSHGALTVSGGRGRYHLENRFGVINATNIDGDVTIVSGNGQVSASSITGSIDATNSFGTVSLNDIGRRSTVQNSNGSIDVRALHGGGELSTSFGTIEAQAVRGNLIVRNRNGHVRVADADGTTSLMTSFGTIVIDRVGGVLTVEHSNGSVRGAAISGSANISTSHGSIVLRDAGGRLDVRAASGLVDVGLARGGSPCQDITLTSSSGPLSVHVPEDGYTVEAKSSSGRIRSEVPLLAMGTIGASSVSATIAGGGCALRLTADGNITIQPGAGPNIDLEFEGRGRAPRPPRPPRPPPR